VTQTEETVLTQALGDIRERLGGVLRGQEDMGRELREIKAQTTKTNGRVNGLEEREAAAIAVASVLKEQSTGDSSARQRRLDRWIGAGVTLAAVVVGAVLADAHLFG